jgi:hypothetical protein
VYLATDRSYLTLREVGDIAPVEHDPAFGGLEKAYDAFADGGFATA